MSKSVKSVKAKVTAVDKSSNLANMFNILSDKTRLGLVTLISGNTDGINVSELCKATNLPQPTVSHHLGLLRMNRVIDNKRQGKEVHYALGSDCTVSEDRVSIKVGDRELTFTK